MEVIFQATTVTNTKIQRTVTVRADASEHEIEETFLEWIQGNGIQPETASWAKADQ